MDEPETEEERDRLAYLGNSGAPCDLTYTVIRQVDLTPELIEAFKQARDGAARCKTLADLWVADED